MLKERSQTFKLIFTGIDLLNSIFSFGLAFAYRYFIQDRDGFYLQIIDINSYFWLSLVLSITQVLSFISIDLYHPRRGLSFVDEFWAIFRGVIVNLGVILSLLFFFRGESFSRLVIVYYTIFNIIITSFVHYQFRFFLKGLRKKGYNLRKLVIIGMSKTSWRIADVLQKHQIYGYTICGYIYVSPPKESMENTLGSIYDLEKIITYHTPDLVIYALTPEEGDHIKETIDICDSEGVEVKVVPAFTEFITARGRIEDIDGIPIITIRNIPIRMGYNMFIKRTFDLLFSFCFLVFFFPVYLLIAIAIRLESRGDIFLKQERVGLDNKKFNMFKFRTMYVQPKTDSDTKWTVKDDPRVTKIGRILRKLSLDEIPQFFNVLLGDMSVVGPRPERPYFVEQFKIQHRQYMRRHAVKSGITGWAQINGLRGDTSIEDRIDADIFYMENWSLMFDIKIVLITPFKGLYSKNAY
ncbi:MAG: undecaprenyl-phosphate glucose phosphotransferase [Leptospiraceae bacterium]|nr:undecaprenyl-phosphate glucose phosphotransferase [Leptospiraceae bacterium]MCP5497605.1 undecaprenyl-phosphate glucose phosphotransferase [Leptospiraceae bacterium]